MVILNIKVDRLLKRLVNLKMFFFFLENLKIGLNKYKVKLGKKEY